MRRTLLALALAALPGIAIASPPAAGTSYTFYDPVFAGTVFCDTLAQVRKIATADSPQEVYMDLYQTPNEVKQPTCAAVVPTGVIVSVVSLGVMHREGLHFNAWAIETNVGGTTGYALYLEQFEMIIA
jgi:hypothetical protein